MKSSETDFDFALKLQLEEATNDSLLHPEQPKVENYAKTLELSRKFEQEREDGEKWMAEMNKIHRDLKVRAHDHKFATEITQIPDADWRKEGGLLRKPFVNGGVSSSSSSSSSQTTEPFRLYFKGLFNEDVAAIGAAVCDPLGIMIFKIQKQLTGDWKNGWAQEDLQMKVEMKALMEGLNAALSMLDIKRINIYCDHYPLFQSITMRWLLKQKDVGTVVDKFLLLQRRFDSCRPFYVARQDVRYAFKIARGALGYRRSRFAESSRAAQTRETCNICLDDTDSRQMFVIEPCLHRYCRICMKQHVEVKLLHGILPTCPHENCNTKLSVLICSKFLPLELIDLMKVRQKESSIPASEKVYCPYPRCSVLMSKTEVLPYTKDVFLGIERSAIRKCIECHGLFCINCKVPWHNNISCRDYRKTNLNSNTIDAKLKSLAITQSWRQCSECKQMVELLEGCNHITCRCGYEFCYKCGGEWRKKKPRCSCVLWDERNLLVDDGRGQR